MEVMRDRADLSMKTDTKETKFIVAQILYMQDGHPHALETPSLANNPPCRAPTSR
jgi:hypothetical protein